MVVLASYSATGLHFPHSRELKYVLLRRGACKNCVLVDEDVSIRIPYLMNAKANICPALLSAAKSEALQV